MDWDDWSLDLGGCSTQGLARISGLRRLIGILAKCLEACTHPDVAGVRQAELLVTSWSHTCFQTLTPTS